MEDLIGKVTLKISFLTESKLFAQKTAWKNINSYLHKRKDCFRANTMNSALVLQRKLVYFVKWLIMGMESSRFDVATLELMLFKHKLL